uniref:StAR related lipid transfer domain containing 5 n=1 Tax=Anas platyrhynchos platyrhynchos TaxID=8840 RepID=A0A493T8B1_ANAPP
CDPDWWAAAAKIGQYRQDPSGWRGCRSTGTRGEVVVSWRPSAEFSGNVYRAEGTVAACPEDVWECIKPVAGGLRTKWDQNVKDFEVVEAVSDAVSVCRTTTPSAFVRIISPREFVDVVLMKQYEDGTMLSAATNVEHPQCPPQPNFVRGLNYPCGCFCIPLPGLGSKCPCCSPTLVLRDFWLEEGWEKLHCIILSFLPHPCNMVRHSPVLAFWSQHVSFNC